MGSPKTILVIDDEMELARMVAADLEDAGYRTHLGYDGAQALQLALTTHPDLVVMDVNMPMTNGIKALGFLRQNVQTRDLPVVLLTGENSAHMIPVIEKFPRVVYLKKPVDFDSLHEQVTLMLTRYGPSDAG